MNYDLHSLIKGIAESYIRNNYFGVGQTVYFWEEQSDYSDDTTCESCTGYAPDEDADSWESSEVTSCEIRRNDVDKGNQEEGFVVLVSVRITVCHSSSHQDDSEVEEEDMDIYVSIAWDESSGDWEVVDCEN